MGNVEIGFFHEEAGIEKIRQEIVCLFREDPLRLGEVDGVGVVQSAEERPTGETCFEYVFGEENIDSALGRLRQEGKRTGHAPGSVAFYFKEEATDKGCEELLRHVGIVVDNGDVISKWGNGPVYQHKPHHVLPEYGFIGGYYQDPRKLEVSV